MSKWAREGNDWIQPMAQGTALQGRRDAQSTRDDETSGGKKNRERRGRIDEETKRPGLVLEVPTEEKKLILEIRVDSETVVGAAEKNGWTLRGLVRSEVSGLCGFWDGSCENGTCGACVTLSMSLSLSRKLHFSVECLARGWTVTEPSNPGLWFEASIRL